EGGWDGAPGVAGRDCAGQRLLHPAGGLLRAPLSLVDQTERDESLARQVESPRMTRIRRNWLEQLEGFLRLAENLQDDGATQTQLDRRLAPLLHDVERTRIEPLRLAHALVRLGALSRTRERMHGAVDRRIDRCARDLTRQPARLLEVVRDDLDELVRCSRQRLRPIRETEMQLRTSSPRHPAVRDVTN